ncbi:MAG: 3-dehydroquinate synthase [Chloroflexota bacterium]|jgi:3-dehydroquinate synthase|nr:3-dehydroquinate synthase [Chloroflexota bacterium]
MSVPDYVAIGRGIVADLPDLLDRRDASGNVFLIADRNVGGLYGAATRQSLEAAGRQVSYQEIAPGETAKALTQTSTLYDWLLAEGAERGDLIIALGGGVVGDLVGFVAATYMRGVKWAQIATSLLAQVDSSIGGKVGVDLPGGKNLVGAFYAPVLSLLDADLLLSLPPRQLACGWAEVIKHGVILDCQFFELLEARFDDPAEPDLLLAAVRRCVEIKAAVVADDPLDRGFRAVLNYGHTIAHAIEACTGYQRYTHGETVAIGMSGAAAISRRLGLIEPAVERRQNDLLARAGLPSRYTGAAPEDILEAMTRDKKAFRGRPRWVLIEGLGEATVGSEVDLEIVRSVVSDLHE